MKNILLLFLVVCCFSLVHAQVEVEINPDPATGSAVLDDPSTTPYDITAYALVTNSSSTEKTYSWTREVVSKPDEWGTAVCDVNYCYSPQTDTQEFTLNPGQAATMDVHAYPGGNPNATTGAVVGEAVVRITVTDLSDSNNTFTGEYILTLEETTSTFSVQELNELQLYPNPTVSSFELKGPEGVAFVKIYNLLGTEIQNFSHSEGRNYDVSGLTKGLYLVALLDEDTQLLKTMRLQKQ